MCSITECERLSDFLTETEFMDCTNYLEDYRKAYDSISRRSDNPSEQELKKWSDESHSFAMIEAKVRRERDDQSG